MECIYDVIFQLCEGQLAEEIVDQMKTDCENMNDDMEAIRDLLDNIEAVCAAKGVQTTIEIPDACGKPASVFVFCLLICCLVQCWIINLFQLIRYFF